MSSESVDRDEGEAPNSRGPVHAYLREATVHHHRGWEEPVEVRGRKDFPRREPSRDAPKTSLAERVRVRIESELHEKRGR